MWHGRRDSRVVEQFVFLFRDVARLGHMFPVFQRVALGISFGQILLEDSSLPFGG
jgi:hypothetical protein